VPQNSENKFYWKEVEEKIEEAEKEIMLLEWMCLFDLGFEV